MSPRQAASRIRTSLLRQIHDLQTRILLVERFGDKAVTDPGIQTKPGPVFPLAEMLRQLDEVEAELAKVIEFSEKAEQDDIRAFVEAMRDRRS